MFVNIFTLPLHPQTREIGSLAQLVQSICLTSRGSGVRIPQLPQNFKIRPTTDENQSFFCCCESSCASPRPSQQQTYEPFGSRSNQKQERASSELGCGGGCEDRRVFIARSEDLRSMASSRARAKARPSNPSAPTKTKRSKKVSSIRHLFVFYTTP